MLNYSIKAQPVQLPVDDQDPVSVQEMVFIIPPSISYPGSQDIVALLGKVVPSGAEKSPLATVRLSQSLAENNNN